jgi:hypothetical protein
LTEEQAPPKLEQHGDRLNKLLLSLSLEIVHMADDAVEVLTDGSEKEQTGCFESCVLQLAMQACIQLQQAVLDSLHEINDVRSKPTALLAQQEKPPTQRSQPPAANSQRTKASQLWT